MRPLKLVILAALGAFATTATGATGAFASELLLEFRSDFGPPITHTASRTGDHLQVNGLELQGPEKTHAMKLWQNLIRSWPATSGGPAPCAGGRLRARLSGEGAERTYSGCLSAPEAKPLLEFFARTQGAK